ncbi:P2X purinoceptor 7-like [Epinephelus fuscoguttatus]|uniref:P2X purinoceptor 7-like n=1 Tax=Epinephelus fuscoguttatus TaxID=293821 RepID=UPI0020D0B112|nr:P2X purinoceptor 7-like [Epinephelus fuscoguttatus]
MADGDQQANYGIRPFMFEPEPAPNNETEEKEEAAVAMEQPRLQQDVSEWCSCRNCATMPTEVENICCMETPSVTRRMYQLQTPPTCMIDHPGFEPVCLNPFALQNAMNIYRQDNGELMERGYENQCRHLAYRSLVSWCWGYLGRRIRVVIPACVVLCIRWEFPDPGG